jgi:UPF0755 protein
MVSRHVAANALTILIVVLFMVLSLITWGQRQFREPGPTTAETMVVVERGARLGDVVDQMEKDGVISNPLIFRMAARYSGADAELKFGEYAIPPGASMEDVLATITSGRGVQQKVTIPEGFTSWQVVQRLNETEDLTGEITAIPAEGTLAPNTYFYGKGDSRLLILQQMEDAQKTIVAEAWSRRAEGLPYDTPEEMVTMASIVEKETGVNSERDLVAGVFVNRLNQGIRLQTDPSVIYGITEGRESLGRGLRRSELARVTPYNTYIIDGLPPGPIANPGPDAIEAAINPAATDYLYFVADGSGGHAFARTLSEHNVNVAEWREIERRQAEEAAAAEAAAAEAGEAGEDVPEEPLVIESPVLAGPDEPAEQ